MADDRKKSGVKGQARKKCHECMFCGKSFALYTPLQHHVNGHIKERAYQCSQCDANYTDPTHLKRHVDTAHLRIRFQCDRCLKWYSNRTNLCRHKNRGYCLGSENGNSFGSAIKKPNSPAKKSKRAIVKRKPARKTNQSAKLPKLSRKAQAQEKICQLKQRSAQRRLTKKTRKMLDKESTSTREPSSSSLSPRNQVKRAKPQKCSVERKKSATNEPPISQQSTSKHNSTNYTKFIDGKRRFTCQFCEKYYTEYGNLIRHCKSSHKEFKPTSYSCVHCDCDVTFQTYKLLLVHKMSQHGMKFFNCPFCSAAFTLAKNLHRHKRSHHPDVIESIEKVKVTPGKQYVKQRKIRSMENAKAVAELESEADTAPVISSVAAPLPQLHDFIAWRDRLEKICEEKRKTYDPKSAYFLNFNRYNPSS